MNSEYKFVKNYKDNEILRHSLNDLAEDSFGGLNFEKWYQSGYWREKYIPYSIEHNNKIVANVSVNIMNMVKDGVEKKYIQLGTVMTNIKYRKKGLSKFLINKILDDYKDNVDGIFLWGNDSVIDFYPKFGFNLSKEYSYSKKVINNNEKTVVKVDLTNKNEIKSLEECMKSSKYIRSFESKNYDLIFFYLINFMEECVYYVPEVKAYVIAEIYDNTLLIDNVFCDKVIDLDIIIKAFGKEITEVDLGFTPVNKDGYLVSEIMEEDRNFYVMGDDFIDFSKEQKSFPLLAHA